MIFFIIFAANQSPEYIPSVNAGKTTLFRIPEMPGLHKRSLPLLACLELARILNYRTAGDIQRLRDPHCPICYEDYGAGEHPDLPFELPCKHVIGTRCLILEMLQGNFDEFDETRCPLCRQHIFRHMSIIGS